MEGYLHKKGQGRIAEKIWRKRYCVYDANHKHLMVFKSVGARDACCAPARASRLFNVPDRQGSRQHRFDVMDTSNGVCHALCAPDDATKQEWLAAIHKSSGVAIEGYQQHPRALAFGKKRKKNHPSPLTKLTI